MTPLSRWIAPALLALGTVAGASGPARAQDTVQVRVASDKVVVRDGQAYTRDARSGRYERLVVRRDRNGRLAYFRVVPRNTYYGGYGYYGGYAFDDTEYRPSARKVDCSSNGNCTVSYYDPYYRWLHGGGSRDQRQPGHRDPAAGRP